MPNYDTALVFTGLPVDLPEQRPELFPPRLESVAADVIRLRVGALSAELEGRLVGISSAGRGSEILFLETCRDLGLDTRVVLPMPLEQTIAAAVEGVPGSDWVDRFLELWHAHAEDEREVLSGKARGKYGDWRTALDRRLVELAGGLAERVRLLEFSSRNAAAAAASLADRVAKAGGEVDHIDAAELLAAFEAAGL